MAKEGLTVIGVCSICEKPTRVAAICATAEQDGCPSLDGYYHNVDKERVDVACLCDECFRKVNSLKAVNSDGRACGKCGKKSHAALWILNKVVVIVSSPKGRYCRNCSVDELSGWAGAVKEEFDNYKKMN